MLLLWMGGANVSSMQYALICYDLQLILALMPPTPAPHGLHATGDPVFQTPWTLLGIPALTLPSGLSDNGFPLGLQLASAPFTEARLFAVASWCERTLALTARPTLVTEALTARRSWYMMPNLGGHIYG